MSEAAGIASALVGFLVFFWIFFGAIAILMIIATWKLYEKAGEPGWASLIPFYRDYVLFKISWGNGWYFLLSTVPAIVTNIFYYSWYISLLERGFNEYGNNLDGYYGGLYNGMIAGSVGLGILMFFVGIFVLVITIITNVKLAKAYGQSGGFACGLIFLPYIFIPIMAFSKDIRYIGIPGKMPPYGAGYGGPNPQNRQTNWQNPYYQANGYQQSPPQYGPNQGWGWQPPEQQNNPYREPYSATPGAESQTPPQDVAKYCPDCGMPLKKDDAFCPRCGKPQ